MFRKTLGAISAALAFATPLAAADLALVLVNSGYDSIADLRGDGLAARYERELEAAGFTVFALQDGTGAEQQAMARDFAAATDAEDRNRLVIVLAGHMVHSGATSYLLGRDALRPDAFSVTQAGQAVEPLVALAGEAQGQAVVMLAAAAEDAVETGTALTPGAGDIALPQGVTLVRGDPQPLLYALRDGLLPTDGTYALAAERAPNGVTYSGFVSPALGLMTGAAEGQRVRPELGDFAYWNAVQDIGTEDAYDAYLRRYPQGTFADQAREQIEGLRNAPLRAAQEGEAALALTREARREVQRYLSLLGHDPRGIDGIFGPATRAALTDWQAGNDFEPTGYLDRRSYIALQLRGERRAADLAQEAEARRAEQEQADRDLWAAQNGNGERGLRTYLDRYPDGLFADTARSRLARIEREERQQANAGARQMWDQVRDADTVEAYSAFLHDFPDSPFSDAARARRAELTGQDRNRAEQVAAQQEEAGVAFNAVTRLLIERRLQQLGLQPGAVDGTFDGQTRRAIRRFQTSRGIAVTGYVSQATMVRLLAG